MLGSFGTSLEPAMTNELPTPAIIKSTPSRIIQYFLIV